MSLNLEKYQILVTLLDALRSDISITPLNAGELRQRLRTLQQLFVQEIAPLTEPDSRSQSYKTEISKQLRLLEVDVMFLQGARQATTAQTRLDTISDRLSTLIQYCHAILQQKTQE
ncbi:heterocyst frequency control protein PatD [Nostoc sp. TCL26-01]|uniref:heterocyst frequency control protein PatD n=1 Tax=Nostoc sp. TCL26-01 TaxID=2576904 RepID=UPI0015BE77E4|nr:heterocyst frequency control protein PatD [Nostoc sp. TCL26-01]QLE55874.1 hypothetical protein FD725_10280 [Nostoc sp. TCL26-01]